MDARDDGRRRLYRVNGPALKPIHDWVARYQQIWSQRFAALDEVLTDLTQEEGGEAVPADTKVTFPGPAEILVTRLLDAPRALAFRAWTTPELVPRWWTAGHGEVVSVEIDLRAGGAWRYVLRGPGGALAAFHGEYREIVPGERIINTEVLETRPAAQALTTVTFTEAGGRTQLAVLTRYDSEADRDEHARYMQDGLTDAMDLLEQVAGGER